MRKSVKILIGIIITLIILWGIAFTIDFFRCRNFNFLDKFIAGAIAEKQNYEIQFELEVKENGKKNIEKITVGELKNKYDYDIYFYGLDSVIIKINNEELDLKEALINDKITMEEIIEKANSDEKNGIIKSAMYMDGGSKEYYYGDYTIIKSNNLDDNKDVYIGIPEMILSDVR